MLLGEGQSCGGDLATLFVVPSKLFLSVVERRMSGSPSVAALARHREITQALRFFLNAWYRSKQVRPARLMNLVAAT
jgi:hypothetical protein